MCACTAARRPRCSSAIRRATTARCCPPMAWWSTAPATTIPPTSAPTVLPAAVLHLRLRRRLHRRLLLRLRHGRRLARPLLLWRRRRRVHQPPQQHQRQQQLQPLGRQEHQRQRPGRAQRARPRRSATPPSPKARAATTSTPAATATCTGATKAATGRNTAARAGLVRRGQGGGNRPRLNAPSRHSAESATSRCRPGKQRSPRGTPARSGRSRPAAGRRAASRAAAACAPAAGGGRGGGGGPCARCFSRRRWFTGGRPVRVGIQVDVLPELAIGAGLGVTRRVDGIEAHRGRRHRAGSGASPRASTTAPIEVYGPDRRRMNLARLRRDWEFRAQMVSSPLRRATPTCEGPAAGERAAADQRRPRGRRIRETGIS